MHDAFMRTIVANPEDDAPRLVYADWLDETGDPANADRAEFIRLQIRLEALPTDDPQRPKLVKREQALLKKYFKTWAEPFRGFVWWWTFRRGFLDSAAIGTEGASKEFNSDLHNLVDRTPLREIVLYQQTDEFGCLLPAAHLMKRLRSFSVRGGFLHSGGPVLRELFESEHLSGLRRLELECARSHTWFQPRTLSAILQSPALANLTELSVCDYITDLAPTVVRTLARSKSLANLTYLSVEFTTLDRAALRGIIRSAYGPNLESLELRHCRLKQAAWSELIASDALPKLKHLCLGGASINGLDIDEGDLVAERRVAQLRERFGADAVNIERTEAARPWFYSWSQK